MPRFVSRAIESFLFVLTGSRWYIAANALSVLTCWITLSDYVMVPRLSWWQSEWESWVYLPAAALTGTLWAGLSWASVQSALRAIRPIVGSAGGPSRVIELAPGGGPRSARAVRILIGSVILMPDVRRARAFLRWKCERLEHMNTQAHDVWWLTWRALWTTWLPALWFPALCAALYVAPGQHWFDRSVTLLTGAPVGFFDIAAEGLDQPGPPGASARRRRVAEGLHHTAGTSHWRRSLTGQVSDVTLTFRTTSFPHLTHRLHAVCIGRTPQCEIMPSSGGDPALQDDLPVRNGHSAVRLLQTTTEPSLNLRVWLARPDSSVVDEVLIEPVEDP